MSEIIEGKQLKKPKMAARLGLTKELWEVLERCWLEDRDQRPDLGIVLSALSDAVPLWQRRKSLRTLVEGACEHLRFK